MRSLASLSLLLISEGLLFHDIKIFTIFFRQGDQGFLFSNNQSIALSGGESFSISISQVDNFEGSRMSFKVDNGSNSTNVVSTGDVG